MKNIISVLLLVFLFTNIQLFSNIERVYVGELQEKWQQPSDHLPIGISLKDGNTEIGVITWNVLNTAYLHWIYNNEQGLAKSAITQNDIKIKDNGFTLRESEVIHLLLQMIRSPSIICLQECSEVFILELQSQLPENIQIIRSSDSPVKNQNIVLYDKQVFSFVSKILHSNVFDSEPTRPLMEVLLQNNEKNYRIYNAHLRCDPSKPQPVDLAKYVFDHKKQGEIIIVLGDLNVEQEKMAQAFEQVSEERGQKNSFQPFTPYRTTVSPELYAKAIDHIFIESTESFLTIKPYDPNSLLDGLQDSVDLLSPATLGLRSFGGQYKGVRSGLSKIRHF